MKTISLENAKKLHEVANKHDVKLPDSEYYYVLFGADKTEWDIKTAFEVKQAQYNNTYKALTSDELLEWLDWSYKYGYLVLDKGRCDYMAGYIDMNGNYLLESERVKNPADALCLLAIKMMEKGIIK